MAGSVFRTMPLLTINDLSHAFGGPPVLEGVNLQVDAGERVCLVGRNGSGKSTFMKLLAQEMAPDSGSIVRAPGVRVARLPQDIPAGVQGTVHDVVATGLVALHDHEEEWEQEVRLEQVMERMSLDPRADFGSLSGGLKRRVLLAQALAAAPDLLLLDEPTNHLDIASIEWLETFLLESGLSLFFVTHDRAFLKKLATRIVELDRGVLTNWDCPYETFLERRAARLEVQEREWAQRDKLLAQEEAWIRRGVKARRARDQGRVSRLKELRAERRSRRELQGNATIRVSEAERSGQRVVEAIGVDFAYPGAGDKRLVRGLDLMVGRGDKIGLLGPNGAGKTTLVKLLLGELQPTAGELKFGTRLEVVYLDQLRAQIDGNRTVAENVAEGNDHVTVDGKRKHVISYLEDFLFEPDRARTPARVLSGGERNRLLLARLFTKPANVLVLDEPTNDLDAETLELLENLLVEFGGTLLVVSHDRDFLDNVVTSTLVAEGDGEWREYVGGYSDYAAEVARNAPSFAKASEGTASKPKPERSKAVKPRKLNGKEKAELESLPGKIETLEAEQAELTGKLADPAFYAERAAEVPAIKARLEAIEEETLAVFARWEELEVIKAASEA